VVTTASPSRRARRGSGAVTLHDVARLAGVAPITASRAVNTPERVSEDVLKRVNEAIASTGYVPNRLAGSLASTRSRLVAAVVPTLSGPIFLATVQALTDALAAQGYQLMLGQTGYAGSREDDLLDAIIGRRPDGIVLTGVMHSAESRRRLEASGIPVVETWDLTDQPVDMLVGFSHVEVGRQVAAFFHARGRRAWALVSGDDERARRRRTAFEASAQALGVGPVLAKVVPSPTTLGMGRAALVELLASGQAVDAVFCSSDLLALGVMTEARARGIDVPGQLAVLGFGDIDFAADLHPALSTVRIHPDLVGQRAAAFIVARAEGRTVSEKIVDIGFTIVERAST